MSVDSQRLLWKLDFNRFLIVTFLLFLHYSHLGGIRFQKDLLKLPPQNPICKYTCNWIFNMYRHRCPPLYAKQSQLTSLPMATRPHCRVQVTDSCNTERGRKIEAIIHLLRLKVHLEWILNSRPTFQYSKYWNWALNKQIEFRSQFYWKKSVQKVQVLSWSLEKNMMGLNDYRL